MKLLFAQNRIAMLVHLATRALIDFCCVLFIDVIDDKNGIGDWLLKSIHMHMHTELSYFGTARVQRSQLR